MYVQNYAMLCATIKSETSMQAKAFRFLVMIDVSILKKIK